MPGTHSDWNVASSRLRLIVQGEFEAGKDNLKNVALPWIVALETEGVSATTVLKQGNLTVKDILDVLEKTGGRVHILIPVEYMLTVQTMCRWHWYARGTRARHMCKARGPACKTLEMTWHLLGASTRSGQARKRIVGLLPRQEINIGRGGPHNF